MNTDTFTEIEGTDGRIYEVTNGVAVLVGREGEQEIEMCECEIDWNCGPCGGTSRPTHIETKWDHTFSDDEIRGLC